MKCACLGDCPDTASGRRPRTRHQSTPVTVHDDPLFGMPRDERMRTTLLEEWGKVTGDAGAIWQMWTELICLRCGVTTYRHLASEREFRVPTTVN